MKARTFAPERKCDDCGGTGWLGHTTGDGQAAPDSRPCPTCAGEGDVVPASLLRGAVDLLREVDQAWGELMDTEPLIEAVAKVRAFLANHNGGQYDGEATRADHGKDRA